MIRRVLLFYYFISPTKYFFLASSDHKVFSVDEVVGGDVKFVGVFPRRRR